MLGGKAFEAAKQAKLMAAGLVDDEEGNHMVPGSMDGGEELVDTFTWSGPGLANLAVRFGTVQYMSESCEKLMQIIVDGATAQNYTGAPLDKVMDSTTAMLKEHRLVLASHIGAHIVCIKLHAEFDGLYEPNPTESRITQCLDGLDETMEDVMPRIPPDYVKFVIEKVFDSFLEVMMKRVIKWRTDLQRQRPPLSPEVKMLILY